MKINSSVLKKMSAAQLLHLSRIPELSKGDLSTILTEIERRGQRVEHNSISVNLADCGLSSEFVKG